jgi:hypothetical protein
MLSLWETNVNELANRSMASEEFSQAMHKATGATHGAREAFETGMRRYLAAINLPSRQEIEAIGERLHAIEAQLHRLTQLIEGLASKAGAPIAESATPKPRRTRTPDAGKGSQ